MYSVFVCVCVCVYACVRACVRTRAFLLAFPSIHYCLHGVDYFAEAVRQNNAQKNPQVIVHRVHTVEPSATPRSIAVRGLRSTGKLLPESIQY